MNARLCPATREIQTGDGSVTLQRVDTGWTYRSRAGALAEVEHVFVRGTHALRLATPRVLEFGFGAGTTFAAWVQAARAAGCARLEVEAVDHAPVHPLKLPMFDAQAHALAVHASTHGEADDGWARLRLHAGGFASYCASRPFDAVCFDPFGPAEQPESWQLASLQPAVDALAARGRLATYACAGWIRRNLAAAGLYVATPPGPAGKRAYTLAAWDRGLLAGMKIRNAPR